MPSDPDPFVDWLAKAEVEVLLCRNPRWRHIWPDPDDKRIEYGRSRRLGLVVMISPCLRGCGVVRTSYLGTRSTLEAAGIKSANSYDYKGNPNYLYKGGAVKTPGTNIGQEHRDAIMETVISLIPADRIEDFD